MMINVQYIIIIIIIIRQLMYDYYVLRAELASASVQIQSSMHVQIYSRCVHNFGRVCSSCDPFWQNES